MSRETDELYNQLKQGPFPHRTFTVDHMNHITNEAAKQNKRSSPVKSRLVWAAAAFVLIISIGTFYAYLKENPAGKEVVATPPIIKPEIQEPASDIPLKPDRPSGQLGEQLPFTAEMVDSITIKASGTEAEIAVPKSRYTVIADGLYWENLSIAKADLASPDQKQVRIRIHTSKGIYSVPYSLDSNTYQLGSARYYADDQVLRLMSGLLEPDTDLAKVERLSAKAQEEVDRGEMKSNDKLTYKAERFNIDGKDTAGWLSQIALQSISYTFSKAYYDALTQRVRHVLYYKETGIFASASEVIFLNKNVQTPDGIQVGLTKQQVQSKLGKPNMETDSRWDYRVGDSLKFHLYFENNKVAFISLTLPA
ncbi:outer membrane protein assembly factor BamE [Paenibacillus sp. YPG26]|uniref:outer membrane protein assembly factor BamE n=1 Tax=Paenibacillus sp. YPG26 TaxID=2878915 RepID=UPI0020401D8B|nr:outer membrane protein assembly factor BamE [Paenibacillus sp. YPG26]USB32283.1 outer membrane protein assembly factor BamE [Paenibacillus sp. YPG26]